MNNFFICSCLFDIGDLLVSSHLVDESTRGATFGLELVDESISLTRATSALFETCGIVHVVEKHLGWIHGEIINIINSGRSCSNLLWNCFYWLRAWDIFVLIIGQQENFPTVSTFEDEVGAQERKIDYLILKRFDTTPFSKITLINIVDGERILSIVE